MKHLLTVFITFISTFGAKAQNTRLQNSAATVVRTVGGKIIMVSTDIDNKGTWSSAGGATTVLTALPTVINGTIAPLFDTLILRKNASVAVTLNNSIEIGKALVLQSGSVNLNLKNIVMKQNAKLLQETNANRIYGSAGGAISGFENAPSPSLQNVANLGAYISSSANLGTTTVSRSHKAVSGLLGILRTFSITPATNSGLNATLRFSYLDNELNGRNENLLNVWQSSDGVTWTDIGATTRSASNNYVEKTGLSALMMYTLAEPSAMRSRSMQVIPNPARQYTTVRLSSSDKMNSQVTVTVSDISGAIISHKKEYVVKGYGYLQVDLSALPAGSYVITVAGGGARKSETIEKL